MAETFLTVKGNQEPDLRFTLQNNGSAINLTDATRVDLILYNDDTREVVNSGHQQCDIIAPATGGVVDYPQNANDFEHDAHRYIGDAKITYSNGRVQILHEQVVIIARDRGVS